MGVERWPGSAERQLGILVASGHEENRENSGRGFWSAEACLREVKERD